MSECPICGKKFKDDDKLLIISSGELTKNLKFHKYPHINPFVICKYCAGEIAVFKKAAPGELIYDFDIDGFAAALEKAEPKVCKYCQKSIDAGHPIASCCSGFYEGGECWEDGEYFKYYTCQKCIGIQNFPLTVFEIKNDINISQTILEELDHQI